MSLSNKLNHYINLAKKNKAFQQVSLMMIISLISQVISMYKSSITAGNFGASVELDAYNFANNLSTFFLTFVSTGITTVIIPAYIRKLDRKAIDTFLTVVFGIVGLLLALIYLFRVPLVNLLTNREVEFGYYVDRILLLTIIIQLLPAILGVTTAYYQCIGKFNFPKVILLISNIFTMIAYLLLDKFTIYEYLYVMLGGAIFQFICDLGYAIYCGFRFRICFNLTNIEFKRMCLIFGPTLLSTGIYKINTMVDSLLSSNLGTGNLTVLSYSQMIVGLINTLIIGNLTAYVYPKIVEKSKESMASCQKAVFNYAKAFHSVIVLLVIGFIGAGREFIGILYEHGEFTSDSANAVYLCMCIYIIDQQNNIVRDLMYRLFMAHGDTKVTTKNGLLTSCANIILSVILINFIGVYGVVLGTMLSGVISLVGIFLKMKITYGLKIDVKPYLFEIVKSDIIMVVGILLIILLKQVLEFSSYWLSFFVFGVISVIIYFVGLFVVRSKAYKLF